MTRFACYNVLYVHAKHYSYITFRAAVFNNVISLSHLHTAFHAALYSTLTKPATAHTRAGHCGRNLTLPLLIISKVKKELGLKYTLQKPCRSLTYGGSWRTKPLTLERDFHRFQERVMPSTIFTHTYNQQP
jgi:hypothetical protein